MYFALIVCLLCSVRLSDADGHMELIDMSYHFANNTLYYPGLKHFTITNVVKGEQPEGYWLEVNNFEASEHGGTHMDAPSHFIEGGWAIHEIPVDRFISPAVVVDVSRHVVNNADYELTVDDLLQWEEQHGMIPDGAVVFMFNDWARTRWPDVEEYFGMNLGPENSGFHFPGFSYESVKWLTDNRVIHGIGLDTASPEAGQTGATSVHTHVLGLSLYIIENVHNLWLLPPAGATVYSFPMKIKSGGGAPCRLIAHVPKGEAPYPNNAGVRVPGVTAVVFIVALAKLIGV